jgi:hypothetical protein
LGIDFLEFALVVLGLLLALAVLVAIECYKACVRSEEESIYKIKLASWAIDQTNKRE